MISTTNIKTTPIKESGVITQMSVNNHEQIVFCNDNEIGLKAIIAIHNTVLGPALGGTRMWAYNNETEALNDVLRLSRGMTYKAAVSGLNLGGGKAVIIGDSRKDKTEILMRRFGKFVDSLGGKYITAEDVGMSTKDMEYIKMETDYVTGIPESMGGSGDPSPVTAYSVYMGMKAAAKEYWGNDNLNGKKIFVQGVGNVGRNLLNYLMKEGAILYISDIYDDRLKKAAQETKAETVSGDEAYELDIDIYAPCALGATINTNTLNKLKCAVIAGAANNQLEDEKEHATMLKEKGIIWAPDFLINAGGLINVYSELEGYTKETSFSRAEKIYELTRNIIQAAKKKNISTLEAAMAIAEKRIKEVGRLKLSY